MTVEAFAQEARAYCEWARNPSHPPASYREALLRLSSIYRAALELPQPWAATGSEAEPGRPPDFARVLEIAMKRLPLSGYAEIFDPFGDPTDELVQGVLGDHVSGVYDDVARGLLLYEAGDLDGALWEWAYNFRLHWGRHATGAIRALHCFLADNEEDLLWSPASNPTS